MDVEGPSLSAEQARLEFGRYLVSQRERRGLSRSELVKATRLPSLLVGAIEDGETEKWPERVFVVNALRTYATAVGLPVEETLSRFDRLAEAPREVAFDPHALETARWAQAQTALAVLAAVIALGVLWFLLHGAWVFVHRAAWSLR